MEEHSGDRLDLQSKDGVCDRVILCRTFLNVDARSSGPISMVRSCSPISTGRAGQAHEEKSATGQELWYRENSPALRPRTAEGFKCDHMSPQVARSRKRGRAEKIQYKDVKHRPLDMHPILSYTGCKPLCKEATAKQYLQAFFHLKDHTEAVASEIYLRNEDADGELVGMYFAADLQSGSLQPRIVLVDFFVRMGHRRKDVYGQMGRWIFNQLLAAKSGAFKLHGNPFANRHTEFCLVVPLTTDAEELSSEVAILEAFGFKPLPTRDVSQFVKPLLQSEAWCAGPNAARYFQIAFSRHLMSMGPTSRHNFEKFANAVFSKEAYEKIEAKASSAVHVGSLSPVRPFLKDGWNHGDTYTNVDFKHTNLQWDVGVVLDVTFRPSDILIQHMDSIGIALPLTLDHCIEASCNLATIVSKKQEEHHLQVIAIDPTLAVQTMEEREHELIASLELIPIKSKNSWAPQRTLFCKVQVVVRHRSPSYCDQIAPLVLDAWLPDIEWSLQS